MLGKRAIGLAVAGLALTLAMTPASANHKQSGRYVGGTVLNSLPDSGPSYGVAGPNIGGVWFAVPSWATKLAASAVDDYSDGVSVDIVFVIDEYGPLQQSAKFCNAKSGIPIPAGTKALYVRLKTGASIACGGVPTTGTAYVTFG